MTYMCIYQNQVLISNKSDVFWFSNVYFSLMQNLSQSGLIIVLLSLLETFLDTE